MNSYWKIYKLGVQDMSAEELRQGMVEPRDRIILALDGMTFNQAAEMAAAVGPYVGMIKVNSGGIREGIDPWIDMRGAVPGLGVMVDGKYYDTDGTMENSVREATAAGAGLVTVHASNTPEALMAAVRSRDNVRKHSLLKSPQTAGTLLGITVLTSETDEWCQREYRMPAIDRVMRLARRAVRNGLEGVVSAVGELDALNNDAETARLLKVTPGIVLPDGIQRSAQARTATPGEAFDRGADFIVVGSAITKAPNPVEAAQQVLALVTESLRS